MSGKRKKSHKGVEHKTKTKSYGRNGEKKQSNKVTRKEWEVRKKKSDLDGMQNACNLNDIM